MNNTVTHSDEIVSLPVGYEQHSSLAVSLARAEVDQQIATARAMPRSITRAVANITTLATLDELSAEECIYALPRAGKPIKGPSVRLAEIIASQWGNCRVGARVVHVDRHEKYIEAEGVFHDLETNTATTARVRRRISNKHGGLLTEDMIVVTGNAAAAIAKRNAILGGVPKAVWRRAYDAVDSVITGDVKTLVERRGRAIAAFAAFGVAPDRVFAALGVVGEDDVGLEHLGTLTAMRATLKNNEATVEEMFPKLDSKGASPPKTISEKLDALAGMPSHDPETGEIADDERVREIDNTIDAAAAPKDEPEANPAEEAIDPAVTSIIAAGKKAARGGHKKLTFWLGKLSAPDYERIEPRIAELKQIASCADDDAETDRIVRQGDDRGGVA
jgi:hypothetical protein